MLARDFRHGPGCQCGSRVPGSRQHAPVPGARAVHGVGVGLGISHGEVGMAVVGSCYMPDDSVIMKASAS
jgi:hypothetical protein